MQARHWLSRLSQYASNQIAAKPPITDDPGRSTMSVEAMAQPRPNAPAAPVPAATRFGSIVLPLSIALISTMFGPALNAVSPLLGLAVQTLLALSIAIALPNYGPVVAIVVLLFQNVFVSICSPLYASDPSQLEFIKGYNFLSCVLLWLVAFVRYLALRRQCHPLLQRWMLASTVVLAAIGFYLMVGVLQDPKAAAIYLRNIVLPFLLFQLALWTASRYRLRVTPLLVAIAVVFIGCGLFEFAFRETWLTLTNGRTYWYLDGLKAMEAGVWEKQMRATGSVMVDLFDRFRVSFFNTPLLEPLGLTTVLRIFGPNISAISFAYGVGFFVLFLTAAGRYLLALAGFALLILCSVKGALLMVLFVLAALVATRLIGPVLTLALLLVMLVVYAAVVIVSGLKIGDYHVIGLMGGVNGFLQQPFGRGLGVGGNLGGDFNSIDWEAAQHLGAVQGAFESAVGVLLYQMGAAALLPLGFCLALALTIWRLYARSGLLAQGMAAFGILIILVNGLFQEEALFSPPALGLMLCMAGLVLGHAIRELGGAAGGPQIATAGRDQHFDDSNLSRYEAAVQMRSAVAEPPGRPLRS